MSIEISRTSSNRFRFYRTYKNFYLQSISSSKNSSSIASMLMIERRTKKFSLCDDIESRLIQDSIQGEEIYGLFGIIRLITDSYLILITETKSIGSLGDQEEIFRIENIEIVPFDSDVDNQSMNFTDQQIDFNQRYLLMIKTILRMPNYYFSYTYDLSSNYQRTIQQSLTSNGSSFIEKTNIEFVWNHFLISDLIADRAFHPYCLPIICGFVSIQQLSLPNHYITWALISRRSTKRSGTRWFTRGINTEGWVANFIETEQILFERNSELRFSFLQIRGSIPMYWTQLPDLSYKPKFVIPNAPHIESYALHVRRLAQNYGHLCFVNLISSTGSEGKLNKGFIDLIHEANLYRGNDIPFVNLESFDFHRECRLQGWEILSKLLGRLQSTIDEYGYTCYSSTKGMIRTQKGIFRTNCIDSLDRTNVVQSLIAKNILKQQLIQIGVFRPYDDIANYFVFNRSFNNVWADNADACSIQYAGTGALKSDFTRTGKRRMKGMIADGLNSLIRYCKNNFEDGFRQDCFDLILGVYRIVDGEGKQVKCPLEKRNVWKIFSLPLFFLFSLFMLTSSIVFASFQIEFRIEQAFYSLFWFTMLSICSVIMYYLGNEFADYPVLIKRC
ncbi:ATP-dependent RNA helicase DDX42-like [Sarcoptes scabiei]|nr:ATP-dependent RNA helicase DDX42-like [Sarcoptes scabiei]